MHALRSHAIAQAPPLQQGVHIPGLMEAAPADGDPDALLRQMQDEKHRQAWADHYHSSEASALNSLTPLNLPPPFFP